MSGEVVMNVSIHIASALLLGLLACLSACQQQEAPTEAVTASGPVVQTIPMDADDISGVVTSASGPEAGIWAIAETDAFATRFARIVVTDDAGRYLVPDLPDADYPIWVRGYGLGAF